MPQKQKYTLMSAPGLTTGHHRLRALIESADSYEDIGQKLQGNMGIKKVFQDPPSLMGRFIVRLEFEDGTALEILATETEASKAAHNQLIQEVLSHPHTAAQLQEEADREGWDA